MPNILNISAKNFKFFSKITIYVKDVGINNIK